MRKVSLAPSATLQTPGLPLIDALLAGASRLGFDGLDLIACPASREVRESWRRQAADAGMVFSGMRAQLGELDPTLCMQDAYLSAFGAELASCVDLGARDLRIEAIPNGDRPDTAPGREGLARAATTWRACARRASDEGVRVLVEAGGPGTFPGPPELATMAEAVDEPNFGVVFDDTWQSLSPETVARLTDRIGIIRLEPDAALAPSLLDGASTSAWWCLRPGPDDGWDALGSRKHALDATLREFDRS